MRHRQPAGWIKRRHRVWSYVDCSTGTFHCLDRCHRDNSKWFTWIMSPVCAPNTVYSSQRPDERASQSCCPATLIGCVRLPLWLIKRKIRLQRFWTALFDKCSPFIEGNVKCMKNSGSSFIFETRKTFSLIIEPQFYKKGRQRAVRLHIRTFALLVPKENNWFNAPYLGELAGKSDKMFPKDFGEVSC